MTSCGIVFYKTGRILALDSLHALHFHVSSRKIGGQILFHIEYKCFPLHVFASCAQTILVWTQKSYHKVHKENYSSCQQIFEPNSDKLKISVSSNNLPWHNFLCKRCNCRNLLKQLYGLRTPVWTTRILTSRLNALKKICRISDFKTRKMIANGIFISRLIYLIQLWGEKWKIRKLNSKFDPWDMLNKFCFHTQEAAGLKYR